jgi:helicase
MAELSVEELAKVLPQRLAQRIKNRINTEDPDFKLGTEIQEPITAHCPPETCHLKLKTRYCNPKTNDQKLKIVLEIDPHRPDRIIFQGKEIKITTRGFSLLYLLAQHKGEVVSYDSILDSLWKDDEEAVYTRINYHICKIRKDILKIMDKKEDCSKKIENIFKTIPGRGLMLDIKEKELETNF